MVRSWKVAFIFDYLNISTSNKLSDLSSERRSLVASHDDTFPSLNNARKCEYHLDGAQDTSIIRGYCQSTPLASRITADLQYLCRGF